MRHEAKRAGQALLIAIVGILVFLTTAGPGRPALGGPVRVLVAFQDGVANVAAEGTLLARGAVVQQQLQNTPFTAFVVLLPEEAIPALGQARGVARVERDVAVQLLPGEAAALGPKKPGPISQPAEVLPWGVNQIDADLAWSTSKGTGVKVAIIDTGISKSHPDLAPNIKGGTNFVAIRGRVDPSKWDDDNGHGSHVAGTVAAADNDIGVIGVASQASLYAVKVLDRNGSGSLSNVVDGIWWSINNNMQVINMSLGCNCPTGSLEQAVNAAYAAGIVVVAAAGNSGTADGSGDTVIYPAKYASVIAVAATNSSNTRPSWSSTGPAVELAAPGVSILSTWKGTVYSTISGTSMASPHVAGSAALVLAAPVLPQYDLNGDGQYSAAEVRAALQGSADDLGAAGRDNLYGYGLVDAQEATTGVQPL
ncbi:MAG: S8 family peptidase [Chloroflexi bacterium]|nr:S8 family peptidase [Chloroflexota bacterium]